MTDDVPPDDELYDIFIVWKCKTIQNWKYILSTNRGDGRIYEATYNGDKHEWYLDVYEKKDKVIIADHRPG